MARYMKWSDDQSMCHYLHVYKNIALILLDERWYYVRARINAKIFMYLQYLHSNFVPQPASAKLPKNTIKFMKGFATF